MYYYRVLVASTSFRGNEPLTYGYEIDIPRGKIVEVPLRNTKAMGVIAGKTKRPPFATKKIIEVKDLPVLPEISLKLIDWIATYYTAPSGTSMQLLLPNKLINIQQHKDKTVSKIKAYYLHKLSKYQQSAVNVMLQGTGTYLLHGETGSGKTRVYIELAIDTFKQNRSSIILTPEIGLTPQISQTFIDVFGADNTIITHSRLTQSERRKLWVHMLTSGNRPMIIIGPRSALFSPVNNVGLIVIDESHESAYRQEQTPHYHANRVAAQLAKLHGARLVLGSATPDINDYYLAEKLNRPILYIPKLHEQKHQLTRPQVSLVDIKNRSAFTKSPNLSDQLIEAIHESIKNHEQSLLFLNRRGTARLILCDNCGWQATCPHCNLPMTFHADSYRLRCHTCGFQQEATSSCPVCKNTNIQLRSIGTKAIAEEISKLFPGASVRRFDTDNSRDELIEHHYDELRSGKIDILVGTQLIAKGLDLPKLSVVGVVAADTSLYFPDYSTDEKAYQLIHQVAGRVGRGYVPSKLIVQSYKPNNPIIQSAVKQAWSEFYDYEILQRKKFTFPPFCYLLKLTCKRSTAEKAENAAIKLKHTLLNSVHSYKVAVDGPAPSFYEKLNNKYRWQLVVKSKDRRELVKIIQQLPSGWTHYIDPPNLL